MSPDFIDLRNTPGFFADRNDGAAWLQAHPEDPYWMGHQLFNAAGETNYVRFPEYWAMAREIKGYPVEEIIDVI